jgi:diguanylate cyclase (GGDEF)-like protein
MLNDRITATLQWISGAFRWLVRLFHPESLKTRGLLWTAAVVLGTLVVIMLVLATLWGGEPGLFDVRAAALKRAGGNDTKLVTGYVTTATLAKVAETLLDKPGGYLSNDIMPPTVFMDNVPNWEFGALVQVRDLAKSLRNDMSRSQSQSLEDPDLAEAEPLFSFNNDSWMLPATEREYRKAIAHLDRYLARLSDRGQQGTQFYARADNLRDWLGVVGKRLGSLSQRLSASVGQIRVNTDLAGEAAATQSTRSSGQMLVKTPWLEIDDVFYEARGATWALIHFLRAVEIDFEPVLRKKNALVSLRQITRELESTQRTVWSPMVLNGDGFGLVTNYSLIMASYISRANAAIIDLRNLLAASPGASPRMSDEPLGLNEADLSGLLLFNEAGMEALERSLADCPVRKLAVGQVLLEPDQPNTAIYVVLDGRLQVHLDSPDNPPLTFIGPGECAGEMSIIEDRHTSAYVVASEPSRVLVVEATVLWPLISLSHPVARNLLYLLSTRVRNSNKAITQEVEMRELYKHIARVDALTGLHNRRWLADVFERLCARAARGGEAMSVIMIDVDNFKRFNDSRGHLAGDHALQQIARVIVDHLRPQDMAARYGGEEIIVLLPGTDLNGALRVAERLREAVVDCRSNDAAGLTISLGVAQLAPEQSSEALLAAADAAMYRAKAAGRNRVSE